MTTYISEGPDQPITPQMPIAPKSHINPGTAAQDARPSAHSLEPRIYPHALRTPRARWWRGLVAIVVLVAAFLVVNAVLGVGAMAIDYSTGAWDGTEVTLTPMLFLGNNLSLVALIPIAFGLQAWLFGQRPRFLSSVVGGIRWRWMLTAAVIVIPIYLLLFVPAYIFGGIPTGGTNVLAFTVIVLLTTPLQAAGEEYAARGLINRAVGSWFARPAAALIVGGIVSSAIFMVGHAASDPWLMSYYFAFGVVMSLLAWRTGGLEVPIVLHAVNNVFIMIPAIQTGGITSVFDRGPGTGSAVLLVPLAIGLVTLGLAEWRARRLGIATRTTAQPAVPDAQDA